MSAVIPKTVPVDVKTLVTVSQFESYMRPPGRPLVIKGWMEKWRAASTWDFDFFKTNYGEDVLSVSYCVEDQDTTMQIRMSDYVDYIVNPGSSSSLKQLEQSLQLAAPFYCLSYKPFRAHPELRDDFILPPFVSDWWQFFNQSFTTTHFPQDQGWILIGPRNAVAQMHQDSHHTLTWLAQIRGVKACFLFSPEDSEAVYQGKVDPANPQVDRYPRFLEATAYHCILNPGEMLFLPPDWWHHVMALDNSITLSCNFVNHINFGYFLRRAFGSRLPEVLAQIPGTLPPQPCAGQADNADTQPDIAPSGDV